MMSYLIPGRGNHPGPHVLAPVTFSEGDQLCLVFTPASVMAVLSMTAICSVFESREGCAQEYPVLQAVLYQLKLDLSIVV